MIVMMMMMDVAGAMKMCIINVAGIVNIRLSSFQITDYNADGLKPFHLCFCSSLLHYDYIRYQLVVDVIFTESPYSYHIVWRWRRNRIHSPKKVSLFTPVYKVPARPDVCTADTIQGPRIFNLKAFNRPLFIYLFYYLFIEFATVTGDEIGLASQLISAHSLTTQPMKGCTTPPGSTLYE